MKKDVKRKLASTRCKKNPQSVTRAIDFLDCGKGVMVSAGKWFEPVMTFPEDGEQDQIQRIATILVGHIKAAKKDEEAIRQELNHFAALKRGGYARIASVQKGTRPDGRSITSLRGPVLRHISETILQI